MNVTKDEQTPKLKVTDRRRFTADGELREDEQSTHRDEPEPTATARAEPVDSEPVAAAAQPEAQGGGERAPQIPPGSLPTPGFADLLSILAEPIALFLGDVPLPDGKSAENLELARFHIDLLGVLKEKTGSNLSREESAVLDDLLYRLRMRYVQKTE